jgi:site-specific DNA-methyltransferase (adenine-specific)
MIYSGDCLDVLRTLPADSVDAIVTDPPYGLSFMGKRWDYDVPSEEIWRECLRVLKPGGHLLAFAGTRTQHRMAVRIEDAGFEIRDLIAWVYGSGFPKSLDVSKAIDKAAGAEREVVGMRKREGGPAGMTQAAGWNAGPMSNDNSTVAITAPATDAARQWAGWGTALKPALEPITVARKPLIGTVAENVLAHGTGALNVDGCRVEGAPPSVPQPVFNSPTGRTYGMKTGEGRNGEMSQAAGRWPANLIHDGSEEVVGLLNDAARFFYCAKASKADRDEGCEGMEARARKAYSGPVTSDPRMTHEQQRLPSRNHHPTVKPTDLMRYLCRLVTPPGGTVLDPFMGSGSTGKAAMLEGFGFIGIERDPEYVKIAEARIGAARRLL